MAGIWLVKCAEDGGCKWGPPHFHHPDINRAGKPGPFILRIGHELTEEGICLRRSDGHAQTFPIWAESILRPEPGVCWKSPRVQGWRVVPAHSDWRPVARLPTKCRPKFWPWSRPAKLTRLKFRKGWPAKPNPIGWSVQA
eukprot:4271725-Amphidinium_carterae.4